jgi:DNA-binding LacI/PurR family transcriptional regulator
MPYWKEGRSEGWILVAPRRADVPGLRAHGEAQADAVVVGASWHESPLPFVDSDNVQGAHLAINHLAELGHRQIALLYADPEASNTQDRLRGFREAMKVHALPVREDWILDVESDYLIDNAMQQRLRAWLGGDDRPTAIFAAGPYIACAVLEAVRDVGLRVPHDLSLVGFDDPTAFADASPAPTTIQQPLEEIGREAIQFLHRRIGAEGTSGESLRTVVPCTLLERASTAIAWR